MPEHIPLAWWLLLAAVVLTFGAMAVEARRSWQNERRLRSRGAVEPIDDVWPLMAAAYPAAFAAMAIESALRGGPPLPRFLEGLVIWSLAKALKAWAIASLGPRWSFRVLVLPGAPLVETGPYRWLRHPNYVAVAAEFVGAAIMMAAPITGILSTAVFLGIIKRRVNVEERALGIR